jgi:hypothetical protein
MPGLSIVIKSNYRQYYRWFTAASLTSVLESISSSVDHSSMLDFTDCQDIIDKLLGNSSLKE